MKVQKVKISMQERRVAMWIKTEIPPVIDDKVALKILFGKARDSWKKNLWKIVLCVMEISEDEAKFFDVEGLTKRVESEYGVYYTRR